MSSSRRGQVINANDEHFIIGDNNRSFVVCHFHILTAWVFNLQDVMRFYTATPAQRINITFRAQNSFTTVSSSMEIK